MLARLRSSFAALNPRYRRLLVVALVLSVLLILNRTVVRAIVQYDNGLDSRIEDLEAQLKKLDEKLASRADLNARLQTLQSRVGTEDAFLLPYDSPDEALNTINACLYNLAVKSGLTLGNVQTRPVTDLGENYQKVSVIARTSALTQYWTRFVYEIEALRSLPEGAIGEAQCPPLPLTIDELTVRMQPGKNQHDASVLLQVSGVIRKPPAPDVEKTGDDQKSGAPAPKPNG
jgi:hypothetical protein